MSDRTATVLAATLRQLATDLGLPDNCTRADLLAEVRRLRDVEREGRAAAPTVAEVNEALLSGSLALAPSGVPVVGERPAQRERPLRSGPSWTVTEAAWQTGWGSDPRLTVRVPLRRQEIVERLDLATGAVAADGPEAERSAAPDPDHGVHIHIDVRTTPESVAAMDRWLERYHREVAQQLRCSPSLMGYSTFRWPQTDAEWEVLHWKMRAATGMPPEATIVAVTEAYSTGGQSLVVTAHCGVEETTYTLDVGPGWEIHVVRMDVRHRIGWR